MTPDPASIAEPARVPDSGLGPILVLGASALAVVRLLIANQGVVTLPLGILSILAILATWRSMTLPVKLSVGVLLGSGAAVLILAGKPLSVWADGLSQMSAIFAFTIVVRLLELPLAFRRYDLAAGAVLGRAAGAVGGGFVVAGGMSYLLACGLSFGSVPISYHAVRAMGSDHSDWTPESVGSLITRSFLAANIWSPLSPVVAFALLSTGVSWPAVLPWTLLLSGIAILLLPFGPSPKGIPTTTVSMEGQPRRFVEFLLFLACLIGTLVGIEVLYPHLGHVGATVGAVLLLVPVWEALSGGLPSIGHRLGSQWRTEIPRWGEQFALFTSGGLLVGAVSGAGTGSPLFAALSEAHPTMVLVLLPLSIVLLAVIGVYPMVTMIMAGTLLAPLGGPGWALLVCIALIVGASVGFAISPYSGLTLLIAALTGKSSFQFAFRWNMAYGLLLLASGTTFVVLLSLWFI